MFTFPRTENQAAPEALHSSGSAPKSTPRRPLSSSTAARSEGARCALTSRRIARVRPDHDVISADRRQAEAQAEPQVETLAAQATVATTSRATEATSIAAATTAAAAGRSRSPSVPKAADAVSAAKSAASSS